MDRPVGRSSIRSPSRWRDISYLAAGNPRQRRAHRALVELGILRDLAAFDPVLVGTIPLAIDVATSDLDIVCRVPDPAPFEDALRRLYGSRPQFRLRKLRRATAPAGKRGPATVARFRHRRQLIEVFGQDLAVEEQAGFRHMVVEARLLALGGETLHRRVRKLKRTGAKTEPAFAELLGLRGDPYRALLDLHGARDATLAALVRAARGR
jgi:Domain of unknown function (DUF4269)